MTKLARFWTLIAITSLGIHPVSASSSWQIKPEFSVYRYKEPGVMKNEGQLKGVTASYTQWNQSFFTRIEGQYRAGQVDYDGGIQSNVYPYEVTPFQLNNIDDYIFGARVLIGRQMIDDDPYGRFYTGLGYRYLNDDSSFVASGYERESNYLYLPLGYWGGLDWDNHWYLSWTAEWDVLLYGKQISHITPKITNIQNLGFGAQGSLELGCHLDGLDLGVSPFIRYWWVDDSDIEWVSNGSESRGYYEPRNNTLEYGLSLVVRF